MTTPAEDQTTALLGMIEAQAMMASLIDGLKLTLEEKGWTATYAMQAAIATVPPKIVASYVQQISTHVRNGERPRG